MTSLEKLNYCYFGLSKSSDSVIFKEENSGGSLTQNHMANCVGFDLQPYSLLLRSCCHLDLKAAFFTVILTCFILIKQV